MVHESVIDDDLICLSELCGDAWQHGQTLSIEVVVLVLGPLLPPLLAPGYWHLLHHLLLLLQERFVGEKEMEVWSD